MNHIAISNIYPSVVTIDDTEGAFDADGNSVVLDEALITAEVTRLQTEYDSLAYARSRKQEYDKLNQWEMQFDDNRDGTTTWVDSINEIKSQFPKG
jgi:flagellar basal body rod protein FlgB